MYQLTVKSALSYVRKALDELTSVEDIDMLVGPDALDLSKIVEGYMTEAVIKTYAAASAVLLEGVMAEDDDAAYSLTDKVITITMNVPVAKILSVKCSDSDVIVSELIPEDSAEGRKQLDKYVRGTYDDPRVVLQKKWNGDHMPILKYYTTEKTPLVEGDVEVEYLPYPELVEGVVQIAPRMEYPVLNNIVAMVFDSLNDPTRAEFFRNKAKEYLGG
jgi:hypothetical protein